MITQILSFILLFNVLSSPERERIYIEDSAEEFLLTINDLPILVDSSGLMSFDEIENAQNRFTIHPNFKPNDYCVNCTYWIKVPLLVSNYVQKQWMVEFYDQTIDSIAAYIPTSEGGFDMDLVGDFMPFGKKAFAHKNFEWMINTNIKGQQNLYFKVSSHAYADIRIVIRTVNKFIYYSLNEYLLYGIFYGMIFIISLYNVLIFFAIRESKYLMYTLYIMSVGVYAMCIDGIAFQYLWPNSPQWNQVAYGTSLFSLIFWSMLFGIRFLNTPRLAPKLNKAIIGALILRTLFFLYALLIDNRLFDIRIIEIIPLTLVLYTAVYVWNRGYKPARFFVLASGLLYTGFLIKALIFLSVIPLGIITYYTLHICFILEMLFLTFALSDRVRILKSDKDHALRSAIEQYKTNATLKDKVNKELAEKVAQRTKQLEEKNFQLADTNAKLIEQTKEINRINSTLDLDNWKLKNNVKEIMQDRLINKNLTIEQFHEIFPNAIACYRFLEKLKWSNGFHCSKCENTKYAPGHAKFARRCTKCGYDESITSNTIFHHLKFPIEKAFYILYVTTNKQKEFTLDELSEHLDLRRNTVWNFKKKIEEVYSHESGKSSAISIHNLFSEHLH
jgi:two-component system, sensor histidine kinase LadS